MESTKPRRFIPINGQSTNSLPIPRLATIFITISNESLSLAKVISKIVHAKLIIIRFMVLQLCFFIVYSYTSFFLGGRRPSKQQAWRKKNCFSRNAPAYLWFRFRSKQLLNECILIQKYVTIIFVHPNISHKWAKSMMMMLDWCGLAIHSHIRVITHVYCSTLFTTQFYNCSNILLFVVADCYHYLIGLAMADHSLANSLHSHFVPQSVG